MKTERRSPRPRRRAVSAAVPALTTLALLSGCGSGEPTVNIEKAAEPIVVDDTTVAPTTRRSSTDDSTPGGISNAVVAPFTLDRTVWFAGFKVHLTQATLDGTAKTLTIEAEVENLGEGQDSLSEDVRIEQNGLAVAEGRLTTESSVLGGSRTAAGVEIRSVPATFNPASAVLVVGDAKHHQVKVPLKGGGDAVTGEPAVLPALAPVHVGSLVITTDELSVRFDDPSRHDQAPADKAFVVLDGSVRFDASVTNVQSQNLSLIPPNGAPQSPRHVNALPQKGSSEDILAVFEMPLPVGGDYILRVKGEYAASDGPGRILDTDVQGDTRITIKVNGPAGRPSGS